MRGWIYVPIFNSKRLRPPARGLINYRRGSTEVSLDAAYTSDAHSSLLTVTFAREARAHGAGAASEWRVRGETSIIDPAEHTPARHNTRLPLFRVVRKIFRVNGQAARSLSTPASLNAYQGIHNSQQFLKPNSRLRTSFMSLRLSALKFMIFFPQVKMCLEFFKYICKLYLYFLDNFFLLNK